MCGACARLARLACRLRRTSHSHDVHSRAHPPRALPHAHLHTRASAFTHLTIHTSSHSHHTQVTEFRSTSAFRHLAGHTYNVHTYILHVYTVHTLTVHTLTVHTPQVADSLATSAFRPLHSLVPSTIFTSALCTPRRCPNLSLLPRLGRRRAGGATCKMAGGGAGTSAAEAAAARHQLVESGVEPL